ncbi:MAG TPA: von Willebrand factor type A domain-containing protein, partial [Thermoanaerobaculia bacterium]
MKRNTVVFLVLLSFACSHATTPPPAVRPGPGGAIHGLVTSEGTPLPGATVTISAPGQSNRAVYTDSDGRYSVMAVPPGTYTVVARLEGFTPATMNVVITHNEGATLTTELRMSAVAESITVTAAPPAVWETPPGNQLPGSDLLEALPLVDGPAAPAYTARNERGFVETRKENVATFAIDVDRASYANIRRYLTDGLVPPPDAVRIEEMVNYFTYDYPQPAGDAPFSITAEVSGCPWNTKHRLLRVGVQGRNLEQWRMAPNNLVFLIDVSGSMNEPRKLPLVQQALHVLVDTLRAEDRISIVVYAGAAGVVLPPVSGADRETILAAIDALQAGGSTAGGAGIELAYKLAQENFLADGNNRVILATDGDFNVGVSSIPELEVLIGEKRASNIFLSVVGVGSDGFNDELMETLADKGNGNYAYLDSLQEAEKVFRHELTGTLVTIAKDVKVQLTFDPRAVRSYRQIGYENRA